MATQKNTDPQAAERDEREEMFSFHPDILAEAGPLPRKSDGSQYSDETNSPR